MGDSYWWSTRGQLRTCACDYSLAFSPRGIVLQAEDEAAIKLQRSLGALAGGNGNAVSEGGEGGMEVTLRAGTTESFGSVSVVHFVEASQNSRLLRSVLLRIVLGVEKGLQSVGKKLRVMGWPERGPTEGTSLADLVRLLPKALDAACDEIAPAKVTVAILDVDKISPVEYVSA